VLSTTGDKVRIGIQARGTCPVFRNEICLEIQQENIAAGTSARAEVNEALKRLSTDRLTDDAFERGPAGHRKTARPGTGRPSVRRRRIQRRDIRGCEPHGDELWTAGRRARVI
jgi:carbon storage regulator